MNQNSDTMLYLAIFLFAVGAVFGIINASAIIRKQPTPKPVVFLHGLLGASGITILIIYVIQHADRNPMVSLVLLAIAALGGFILFARDMAKKPGPVALVLIHAFMALAGVVALVLFVL